MKHRTRILMSSVLTILVLMAAISPLFAQDKEIKAELPALITSCGQSPGPLKLKVFMKRLQMDHEYSLQEDGKPFKTLIIVTGASLKGMGAAGISIKDELERAKALIEEANKQKILVIGSHIEGMARRAQGAALGDNSDEMSIDAVCPASGLMIIRKDGDEDGRFSTMSKAKEIPMLAFEKNMELGDVLKKLFTN